MTREITQHTAIKTVTRPNTRYVHFCTSLHKTAYSTLTHSWSWALLEKPPIVKLLKKFPACYGIRRFITAFTKSLQWSISWARSIQSTPSHPISPRSILILSSRLRLGLPSGLCPSDFLTNIVYAFLFSTFVRYALPVYCKTITKYEKL
jgi:hypothetical protein